MRIILILGLAWLLCGCTYTFTRVNEEPIDEVGTAVIMDSAWQAFESQDFEEAQHLAEYVVEERPESNESPEAYYVAGEASFQLEEHWNSFQHFRELLARYPRTQYVDSIMQRGFQSGDAYLSREPGLFGHLFTNRSKGVQIMNYMVTQFSRSTLADDAQIAVADYYFLEEDYMDAGFYYAEVIKNYNARQSEWVEKALFRLGVSYIKGHKGFSYDREDLLKALMALRSYLTNYPQGGYIEDARAWWVYANEQLARKELEIARYYLNLDCDYGARLHLANLQVLFADTEAGATALALLEEKGWDASEHSADRLVPKDPMQFLP